MAYNDNAIYHGVDEIVVEDVLPDCLHELAAAVSHELAALGIPAWVPA